MMTKISDKVRYSRAGDQSHYRWAARRCLGLLNLQSDLICITIEGVSSKESPNDNAGTGEEVVDIAEYYGDRSIKCATKISYYQLKHSYVQDKPWTLSALGKTLTGFFKRFKQFRKEAENTTRQTVDFIFISNRPPIKVLSLASGLPESAIRSFVVDLGRPLSCTGDAVQFFDEPSETWFRETYKPAKAKLIKFIKALQPFALENSYVASALPQLMLEAGQYDQLVDLALKNESLPNGNPIDKRNVSLQRLQFALKAALVKGRNDDAAKLALKAGGETASHERQDLLIRENTDLISRLLPADRLREIVARKTFKSDWLGGQHAYRACLLSGCKDTLAESSSHLRLAHRWAHYWSRLSKEERGNTKIHDHDIAEMAMCQLYFEGAEAFVKELEKWKPETVSYQVGSIIFRRMVDLGQYDLINEIIARSSGNINILLAAINEQSVVLKYPHSNAVKAVIHELKSYTQNRSESSHGKLVNLNLSVVNPVVQAAIARSAMRHSEIADILDIYLPTPEQYNFGRYLGSSRFELSLANCMRAALRGHSIELADLAAPEMKEQMAKESHYHDRNTREFLEDFGAVLPWHRLWTRALLGQIRPQELDREIDQCVSEAQRATRSNHGDNPFTLEEIAEIWVEILLMVDPTKARMDKFSEWKRSLNRELYTPASSLAIFSRWKDRKFSWAGRVLPCSIKHLVELDKLSSSTALALIGYQYNWSYEELIQSAIASAQDNKKQKELFSHAVRYLQIRGAESQEWEFVSHLASKNGWEDWGFEEHITLSKNNEEREHGENGISLGDYKPEPDPPKDWDSIFGDLQETSPVSIREAYKKLRTGEPPYSCKPFADEFFRRVTHGKEKDAVNAIFNVRDFSLYDIHELYEALPQKWLSRNHIRSELKGITETICKRYFYEIAESRRYYQILPLKAIEKCSGVTENQIYRWVIEAATENPNTVAPDFLFSLVGLIAPALSIQQASTVLDYGLELLEEDMADRDGDGNWSSRLQPPDNVKVALAGYLWKSLASPDTAERWQAAHVVCLLCAFERQEILSPLLSFSLGCNPVPFHDSNLPFYELSAKLWLLIALRRAVRLGYAKSVLHFDEFIRQSCHPTERHILLRGISAKILLDLDSTGTIRVSGKEKTRLKAINSSRYEVVFTNTCDRNLKAVTPRLTSKEDEYLFGYDISRYWFGSLARIFSFGSDEIENRKCKSSESTGWAPIETRWRILLKISLHTPW